MPGRTWEEITRGSELPAVCGTFACAGRISLGRGSSLVSPSRCQTRRFSQNIRLASVGGTFVCSHTFVTGPQNNRTGHFSPEFGLFTIGNSWRTKAAHVFGVSGFRTLYQGDRGGWFEFAGMTNILNGMHECELERPVGRKTYPNPWAGVPVCFATPHGWWLRTGCSNEL